MAGVKLTKHNTFLPRSDFMQLVYACCSPARPGLTDAADLLVPPPAIWKPEPLWTGKQVQRPPCNAALSTEGWAYLPVWSCSHSIHPGVCEASVNSMGFPSVSEGYAVHHEKYW